MHTQETPRKMKTTEVGLLAEITVADQNYRNTVNLPYTAGELTPDEVEVHLGSQEVANDIIARSIQEVGVKASEQERAWHAGRFAVMAFLGEQKLGTFEPYFLGKEAIPSTPEIEQDILPAGEIAVVQTNNRIYRYSKTIDDPFEFLDTSLGVIDRQKKLGRDKIGPENYATAMKEFADKYSSIESEASDHKDLPTSPNLAEVKELMDESLTGFLSVASRDTPNYVEMTNVYAAIRTLPKGAIDKKFTHDLLMHSVNTMDQFNHKTTKVLLGALPKIDTSAYPLEASSIVNLGLRRGMRFDTTRDVRIAVRAIDSLQKNPQTDAALEMFFELSEGLDQPLDLEGADEVLDRLHRIIDETTEDPALSSRAKKFGYKCMARVDQIARQQMASGTLTQAQVGQLRTTYDRIKTNYLAL